MFVYAYRCTSVWRNPVRPSVTLPTAYVSTRGDLSCCASPPRVHVRVRARACVLLLQAGKVPVLVCQGVEGDTPFICVWVSLFCCGSFPSEQQGAWYLASVRSDAYNICEFLLLIWNFSFQKNQQTKKTLSICSSRLLHQPCCSFELPCTSCWIRHDIMRRHIKSVFLENHLVCHLTAGSDLWAGFKWP